jgi:hypothetical protein
MSLKRGDSRQYSLLLPSVEPSYGGDPMNKDSPNSLFNSKKQNESTQRTSKENTNNKALKSSGDKRDYKSHDNDKRDDNIPTNGTNGIRQSIRMRFRPFKVRLVASNQHHIEYAGQNQTDLDILFHILGDISRSTGHDTNRWIQDKDILKQIHHESGQALAIEYQNKMHSVESLFFIPYLKKCQRNKPIKTKQIEVDDYDLYLLYQLCIYAVEMGIVILSMEDSGSHFFELPIMDTDVEFETLKEIESALLSRDEAVTDSDDKKDENEDDNKIDEDSRYEMRDEKSERSSSSSGSDNGNSSKREVNNTISDDDDDDDYDDDKMLFNCPKYLISKIRDSSSSLTNIKNVLHEYRPYIQVYLETLPKSQLSMDDHKRVLINVSKSRGKTDKAAIIDVLLNPINHYMFTTYMAELGMIDVVYNHHLLQKSHQFPYPYQYPHTAGRPHTRTKMKLDTFCYEE